MSASAFFFMLRSPSFFCDFSLLGSFWRCCNFLRNYGFWFLLLFVFRLFSFWLLLPGNFRFSCFWLVLLFDSPFLLLLNSKRLSCSNRNRLFDMNDNGR